MRHIGVGLRDRNAGPEPRDAAIGKASQYLLDRIEVVTSHLESTGHHTSDHARLRIDTYGATHYTWIAAEASLPVSITKHYPLRSARLLVGRAKPLSGGGRHIERLENAVRNHRRVDLLRLCDSCDACSPRQPNAHGLEAFVMRRKGEIHRGR